MASEAERGLIVNYALRDEGNLEVACKIAFAFDEIRKKIITDFVDFLENTLRETLGDEWKIKNDLKENVFARWRGLYVSKKEWGDNYSIGISSQRTGPKDFMMLVTTRIKEPIDGGKLKNLLDEKYGQGMSYPGSSEWCHWVDDMYRDWDSEEVLIKMNFKKVEVASHFKERILRVKEIAEQVIDEAIKRI